MTLQSIIDKTRKEKERYENRNEGFNSIYSMLLEYKEQIQDDISRHRWIPTEARVPESWPRDKTHAPYYEIRVPGFSSKAGPIKAMFIDGEWCESYISKIHEQVDEWKEV
jgi:hypothetical protein